jgi:threonine dehydrogenase-like Zn-dependent dehydrogenase
VGRPHHRGRIRRQIGNYSIRGAILYSPGDVRSEEHPDPVIMEPTDAIVRTLATGVCLSDLLAQLAADRARTGHRFTCLG